MDIEGFKDITSPLPHKIPNKHDFFEYLKQHNIKPDDKIFFYDDFSITGASRAHFIFTHYEIPSNVLNFKIGKATDVPTEEGEPKFKPEVN